MMDIESTLFTGKSPVRHLRSRFPSYKKSFLGD